MVQVLLLNSTKNVLFSCFVRKIITQSYFMTLFNLYLVGIVFPSIDWTIKIGKKVFTFHSLKSLAFLIVLHYHRLRITLMSPRSFFDFLNHHVFLSLSFFHCKLFINGCLILCKCLSLKIYCFLEILF